MAAPPEILALTLAAFRASNFARTSGVALLASVEEGTAEIKFMIASEARSARPRRVATLVRAELPVLIRALLGVI
jgi:hypothetical protein